MRVKSELQPGQAARGDKLIISEVLAEYLRAERGRLAPKTYAQYTEVIALFTQSLNGYAANSLSRFERARFDKLFNAEGEQHREFCDIFGPEHILENVGEFLTLLHGQQGHGRRRYIAGIRHSHEEAGEVARGAQLCQDRRHGFGNRARSRCGAQSTSRGKALGASSRPDGRSP